MGRPARSSLLALSLAAVLAAGCGDDTVDTDDVEGQIEQQLATATVEISSVSCPTEVEEEMNGTFECKLKLQGGGKAVVTVTQRDDDGEQFTYEVKPGTMVLADDSVEPYLEKQLAAEGATAEVDCPDVAPVKTGASVSCSAASSGGRTASLTFTWQDQAGTVDESSVDAGA